MIAAGLPSIPDRILTPTVIAIILPGGVYCNNVPLWFRVRSNAVCHPIVCLSMKMPFAPQLDQKMEPDHPAMSSLAQLSEGGGKVSPVKVRDFVEGLKIGLNRALSPGVNHFDPVW